jgi:hypothetical protein
MNIGGKMLDFSYVLSVCFRPFNTLQLVHIRLYISVAIPRDYDVIFGIISKTKIARFGKEISRKYFISVPISLGYEPVYGEKISFP